MNADVFVSYSSKDKNLAEAMVHYLEEHKIRCWIAPRDITGGIDYADAIVDALHNASVVVFMCSKHSLASEWCKGEVNRALSYEKKIVPFKIDDASVSGGWDLYLGKQHWIDAVPHPENLFVQLVHDLKGLLGRTDKASAVVNPVGKGTKKRRVWPWVALAFGMFALIGAWLDKEEASDETVAFESGELKHHETQPSSKTRKASESVMDAGGSGLEDVLEKEASADERDKSAAAFLKKELAAFDPIRQIVQIQFATEKPTVLSAAEVERFHRSEKLTAGEIYLRYYCQFSVLQDVYFKQFLPRFTNVLEQVSSGKPTVFRPTTKRKGDWWRDGGGIDEWVASIKGEKASAYDHALDDVQEIEVLEGNNYIYPYLKNVFVLDDYRKPLKGSLKKLREGKPKAAKYGEWSSSYGRVEVVTKCNSSMTLLRGKAYFLSPAVNEVFVKWLVERFFGKTTDDVKSAGAVDYLLRLLDEGGEEVAVKKVTVLSSTVFLSRASCEPWLRQGAALDDLPSSFVWGPWLNCAELTGTHSDPETPCVHMSKIFPIDIRLSAEDVKRVKKISISLAEVVE